MVIAQILASTSTSGHCRPNKLGSRTSRISTNLKKGAKLLARWPLDITQAKRKAPIRKPKLRGKLQKNPIETPIEALTKLKSIDKEDVAMSITKITSKIYESGSYDKVVNNLVYGHC